MTLPIPAAALEQHTALLGKTGSGKSNLAKAIVEETARAGGRFCAIDPTGTWFGLRLERDGRTPSDIKPVIFGGNHADIQISPEHGAAVAEAIGTSSDSAIIDTRSMSVSGRTRFFTDFAEALLRTNRGKLTVVVDEAHLFAPKGRVNDPKSSAMLTATSNLVSLGRGIGLNFILISQRPAKLHNDTLSCCETMIAMRLILPHDRNAVMDWIRDTADVAKGKEIVSQLPAMKLGDAWVWSPVIEFLERIHAPLATTFDSGSIADASAPDLALQPIDVAAIGERLDAIRQDVLANDPKRLKARNAQLEQDLAKARAATPAAVDTTALEAGARDRGFKEGVASESKRLGRLVLAFAADFALASSAPPADLTPSAPAPMKDVQKVLQDIVGGPVEVRNGPPRLIAPPAPDGYTPSTLKLVDAIISAYPLGLSLAVAAKRAGLSSRSSQFNRYLREAATDPRIQDRGDGRYVALQGQDGLPAPRGLSAFKEKLPPSYAAILTAIEISDGIAIGLDDISTASGVSRTSSGLTAGLKELVALGLVDKLDDGYRLSPDFGD